jgi:hypothetical protein
LNACALLLLLLWVLLLVKLLLLFLPFFSHLTPQALEACPWSGSCLQIKQCSTTQHMPNRSGTAVSTTQHKVVQEYQNA